jgi:hypothetical protein
MRRKIIDGARQLCCSGGAITRARWIQSLERRPFAPKTQGSIIFSRSCYGRVWSEACQGQS